jgi:hypothetical protein
VSAYDVVHGALCACGMYRGRAYTRWGIHDRHECPPAPTAEQLLALDRHNYDGTLIRLREPKDWHLFRNIKPWHSVRISTDWDALFELLQARERCAAVSTWENEGGR